MFAGDTSTLLELNIAAWSFTSSSVRCNWPIRSPSFCKTNLVLNKFDLNKTAQIITISMAEGKYIFLNHKKLCIVYKYSI